MKKSTIDKLCCPFDKADLQLTVYSVSQEQDIIEGLLSCDACKRNYPIIYGIPIMQPDEFRQPELEQPVLDRWKTQDQLSF